MVKWFTFENLEDKEPAFVRLDAVTAVTENDKGEVGIWIGASESCFMASWQDGQRLKELLGLGDD